MVILFFDLLQMFYARKHCSRRCNHLQNVTSPYNYLFKQYVLIMVEVLGATLNEERSAEQVPNEQCQTVAKLYRPDCMPSEIERETQLHMHV